MKTKSELTNFYYKKLYPTLQKLEKERKQLKSRLISIGFIYTSIALIIFSSIFHTINNPNFIIGYGFFYIAIGTMLYKYFIKDYTKKFKKRIIAPLISALDKNLDYNSQLRISDYYFNHSKLFNTKADKITGNDYVSGKIDNINIQFSDLNAIKEHKDIKGNKETTTIFQGLFIICDFNKNFKAQTVVLPDSMQKTFGNLVGNWFQSNNFNRDELVKMDNIEFEKEFVVYSSDQIEARYILSHTLMDRLLNFQKHSNHPVSVSFIGGKIYIAVEYNKDLFEPSIFHSLLKYKIALEYVETLHLAIGIVEELKLNKKLWSKL